MSMTMTAEHPTRPWAVGRVPADFDLAQVRVVLPDRVTDVATVAVREGRIDGILEGGSVRRGDLDGGGALLAPGLIDVHSDALEKERSPRPTAELPLDFAMSSFEPKLMAAGITTVFHGAGFQTSSAKGVRRDPRRALEMSRTVDAQPSDRVDHHVLHRFDVRGDGSVLLRERLAGLSSDHPPILLSHEDHTPGQGQYADLEAYLENLVGHGMTPEEARRSLDERLERARSTQLQRERNLAWAGELAAAGKARLLGHDPDSREAVDQLAERGGCVAEFPTTVEAARRARELGMLIVAGAPNVLRGGSHSGNVSAIELVREGLVDALASDYLPSSLLGAVRILLLQEKLALPTALRLVTDGPAQVAGFSDRGRIEPGLLADLVLIDDARSWPRVLTTFRSQAETS